MNPYVAEALSALQRKGYTREQAQAIIDRFLAANPQDEHRLYAALNLGTSAVTGNDLLAAAHYDRALADRAYVRALLPASGITNFGSQSSAVPSQPTGGGALSGWLIPVALLGGAAYFFWRR
jgi:hypothetical protein